MPPLQVYNMLLNLPFEFLLWYVCVGYTVWHQVATVEDSFAGSDLTLLVIE